MKISAVTVCFGYADHLARGIEVWRHTLDEWVVVTHPTDGATIQQCERRRVRTVVTDAFARDGARFNKAAALDAGLASLEGGDWLATIDADVSAPRDWRARAEHARPGFLYGARRSESDGELVPEGMQAGFFQLWHSSDPRWTARPSFGSWMHCGSYDEAHLNRWPDECRAWLPLTLVHHGERRRHWCGRGAAVAMAEAEAERVRRGGWDHENLGQ